jgi:hypothetical protein
MRRFYRLVLTLVVTAAIPAGAQVKLDVQGPYTQAASGMVYPETVDDFRRISVMQYKSDGTDVSAGYQRPVPNAEIVATAYSFPTPPPPADVGQPVEAAQNKLCGALAGQVVREIEATYPSAQRVRADLVSLSQNGAVQHGYHALYSMTVPNFQGRQQEAVKSEAYVFCYAGGKWTVEYRFTYPAAADAAPAIAKFMSDLKWTYAP